MSHISPQVRGHFDGRMSHETRAGIPGRTPTLSPIRITRLDRGATRLMSIVGPPTEGVKLPPDTERTNLTKAIDAFLEKYPDDAPLKWKSARAKPSALDVMVGDLVSASERHSALRRRSA